jgi:hypothetical protein
MGHLADRRTRSFLLACACACAVEAAAGDALAASPPQAPETEPPPQLFRLEYHPAPSCPPPEHFTYQLQSRTRRVVPARPGDPALTFVVQVLETPRGAEGRLWVVEPSGLTSERSVPGSNCTEVIAAMALIAAVMVDPSASLEPIAPMPPAAPDPPPRRDQPPPEPPDPPPRFRAGFGIGVTVQTEVAPQPVFGLALYGEAGETGQNGVVPYGRLELHVSRSASDDFGTDGPGIETAEAQFSWFAARFVGCPASVAIGPIRARPCVFFDAGALSGRGFNVVGAQRQTGLWSVVGALLDVEALVEDTLVVAVQGGAGVPLEQDRFYFDRRYGGRAITHEVSALALHAALSVGVRFF